MRIEEMLDGAAVEMINTELKKVYDDIQDFAKAPESKRTVKIQIVFQPNDSATAGSFTVAVDSTLGKQNPKIGLAHFGRKSGRGVAAEFRADQPTLAAFGDEDDDPIETKQM